MNMVRRHYHADDAERISDFLTRHYRADNADGNWLQPAWEYALTHPALDESVLGNNTIWESNGDVVGFVHYESRLGEAFFQVHPDAHDLLPAMLDCAEVNLRAANSLGHVSLSVYAGGDTGLRDIARARGYVRREDADRPLYERSCADLPTLPALPDGFTIRSLRDDNDLLKVNEVLWRGFNHTGEPEGDLDGRRKMQSGPHWRDDLAIVAVAPDGRFVAYCGTWFVPANGYAYLEPVATDPAFRRRGLGTAVVTEGLRRCAELGAETAYVGSSLPFYVSMGFRECRVDQCWWKQFER